MRSQAAQGNPSYQYPWGEHKLAPVLALEAKGVPFPSQAECTAFAAMSHCHDAKDMLGIHRNDSGLPC